MSKSNDGDPPNKRRKCDSPAEPVETTKITDVNDNCLEHIFKHLTVSDLLNVADTSKSLNNAVHLAFVSNYGKHTIKLDYMKSSPPLKDRSIDIFSKYIRTYDFPTCLKILRCFGASITKLETHSTHVAERERDELDRYLGEYCAESLVELKYGRATLEHLTKSFTKVVNVCFSHASFRCNPADIQRCFPNVRNLALDRSYAINSVAAPFPHLEHLDLYVSGKQRKNFARCLQLNPQLRILHISGHNLSSKFLRMLSECPKLESLFLDDRKTAVIDSNSAPINFKTVRQFDTCSLCLDKLDEANISITFDQLDEVMISGVLNENTVRFVSKHPLISKFTFKLWTRVNRKETLLLLIKALPSVKEVRMQWSPIPADSVLDFMSECKLLKYLEFRLGSRDECYRLRDSLEIEWQLSIHDFNIVTLEREIQRS